MTFGMMFPVPGVLRDCNCNRPQQFYWQVSCSRNICSATLCVAHRKQLAILMSQSSLRLIFKVLFCMRDSADCWRQFVKCNKMVRILRNLNAICLPFWSCFETPLRLLGGGYCKNDNSLSTSVTSGLSKSSSFFTAAVSVIGMSRFWSSGSQTV